MDAFSLVPSPDALPNAWGWFYALLVVTFLLHLLAMNFLLGGSLISLYKRLKGETPSPTNRAFTTLTALTVNFGVPPLLFLQVLFGHFFYTSSVLMAVYWIAAIPVLILAYYAAYIFRSQQRQGSTLALVAHILNVLGLLFLAFLFVNNMSLMLEPDTWGRWFETSNGTLLHLGDSMLWPRYLHMVVGAVAVAGLGRAVYYRLRPFEDGKQKVEGGLRLFAYASLVQVLIGLWFLMALRQDVKALFMGGDPLYAALLLVGIALGLGVIVAAIKGRLWLTFGGLLVTLLVMIFLRDLVRHAYLGKALDLSALPVHPEWSPLVAFLLVFVAGVGLLAYMIRRVWRSLRKEAV